MNGYQAYDYGQALTFCIAIAVGAVICVIYDLFRILRAAHRFSYVNVFIQDVLWFLTAAILTCGLMLVRCSGVVRIYALVGETVGFVACRVTLSRVLMKASKSVIKAIKRALRAVKHKVGPPIMRIELFFEKKFVLLTEKTSFGVKKHLKHGGRIVYNHIKFGKCGLHSKRRRNHENSRTD